MDWVVKIWTEIGEVLFVWPPSLATLVSWFAFLAGVAAVAKAARVAYNVLTIGTMLGWKAPRALYQFKRDTDATRMAIAMFRDGPFRAYEYIVTAVVHLMMNLSATLVMVLLVLQPATETWARIPMVVWSLLLMLDLRRYGRKQMLAFRRAADLVRPGTRVDKLEKSVQELTEAMSNTASVPFPVSVVFNRVQKATNENIEVCREYLRLAQKQLDEVTRPPSAERVRNPLDVWTQREGRAEHE